MNVEIFRACRGLVLFLVLLLIGPADGQGFPETKLRYHRAEIEIPISLTGGGSEVAEIVVLDTVLAVENLDQGLDRDGHRQLSFTVKGWEAVGHSEVLDATLSLSLAKTPQSLSVALAHQPGADFPATVIYNAIYDVYLDSELLAVAQAGILIGKDVTSIPPTSSFSFHQPFSSPRFSFSRGNCGAFRKITRKEFERGAEKVSLVREGKVSLRKSFKKFRR